MVFKQYRVLTNRCTHCHRCMSVCSMGAIKLMETGLPRIENSKCKRCGTCKKSCKQRAITSRVHLQF